MDIELLKSAPDQDQIHEMMLMMQMDKLPDFSAAYNSNDVNQEIQMMDNNNNNNNNSPTFMNQPSTISFGGSPPVHQEVSAMNFLSSSSSGRWRNDEMGGANMFSSQSDKRNSMAAMREMIFRIAAMQPIHIDPASVKPPKRRNVKISNDPQSVAARHRRERISEKIRILQRLVPGGTKMDTASMLDEAIHYVKFLKNQIQSLERSAVNRPPGGGVGFPVPMSSGSYLPVTTRSYQNVHHYADA